MDHSRVRLVRITFEELVRLMRYLDGKHLVAVKGLPEDFQVLDIWTDPELHGQLVVKICSDQFQPMKAGHSIPELHLGWSMIDLPALLRDAGVDLHHVSRNA